MDKTEEEIIARATKLRHKTSNRLQIAHFNLKFPQFGKTIQEIIEEQNINLDEAIKSSLIGSRILDIKVEPIKRRKTMVLLTIKTDAKMLFFKDKLATINLSEIKVRVKK